MPAQNSGAVRRDTGGTRSQKEVVEDRGVDGAGPPGPMKMGTTASPSHHDAGTLRTLRLIILRLPAISRCAQIRRKADVVRVAIDASGN